MSNTVLDYSERAAFRKTYQFRNANRVWDRNSMGSPLKVGKLLDIITQVKPNSLQEWRTHYLQKVIGLMTFYNLVKEWQAISKESWKDSYMQCHIRIIDQTYEGYMRENLIIRALNNAYPKSTFHRPDYFYDMKYKLDVVLKDNSERGFTICYQIKPPTFFKSRNIDWAKKALQKSHSEAEKEGMKPYLLNSADIERGVFRRIHYSEIL